MQFKDEKIEERFKLCHKKLQAIVVDNLFFHSNASYLQWHISGYKENTVPLVTNIFIWRNSYGIVIQGATVGNNIIFDTGTIFGNTTTNSVS